jgi:hypothetical protein
MSQEEHHEQEREHELTWLIKPAQRATFLLLGITIGIWL